jgi:hypothetical protein
MPPRLQKLPNQPLSLVVEYLDAVDLPALRLVSPELKDRLQRLRNFVSKLCLNLLPRGNGYLLRLFVGTAIYGSRECPLIREVASMAGLAEQCESAIKALAVEHPPCDGDTLTVGESYELRGELNLERLREGRRSSTCLDEVLCTRVDCQRCEHDPYKTNESIDHKFYFNKLDYEERMRTPHRRVFATQKEARAVYARALATHAEWEGVTVEELVARGEREVDMDSDSD